MATTRSAGTRQLASRSRTNGRLPTGSRARPSAAPHSLTTPRWDSESLWHKARLYAEKAHRLRSGDKDFPFFCALSLEFLSRAALASVHPVLLAKPDDNGVSILHAVGVAAPGQPRSVEMKTVYARLAVVCPSLGESQTKFCQQMANWRNEELHAGSRPFDGLEESQWLTDYYLVSRELCKFMRRRLADYLGSKQAHAASALLKEAKGRLRQTVERKLAAARKALAKLTPGEIAARANSAQTRYVTESALLPISRRGTSLAPTKCPVCGHKAHLVGRLISESDARYVDGELLAEATHLAESVRCYICDLELNGPQALVYAHLQPRFTTHMSIDPMELFEFDGPDAYMNM
jgi:hypothetical protein